MMTLTKPKVTSSLSLFLLLLIAFHGLTIFPAVYGHYPWTTVIVDDEATNQKHVQVILSDQAGIPDPTADVRTLEDHGVHSLTHTANCRSYEIELTINDDNDALIGDLNATTCNCSAYVSGYLDWGPYKDVYADTINTFVAQTYKEESDFNNFFVPALQNVNQPTIFLRNCIAGAGIEFAIGGFPSLRLQQQQHRSNLWLCLYWKSGIEIKCKEFPTNDDDNIDTITRGSMSITPLRDVTVPIDMYALGEMKVTDTITKKVNVTFATTSVSFQGFCTE